MKKCKTNQIINPESGRCVKKDGKIGKKIVSKSPKNIGKKIVSKSPKNIGKKILNPETGRYVNADGKIGKKILQVKKKFDDKKEKDWLDFAEKRLKKSKGEDQYFILKKAMEDYEAKTNKR